MRRISWLVRGALALAFTLINTGVASPYWLLKSFLIWRRSPPGGKAPSILQWYLTFSSRAFLYWLAYWRGQPYPNTRTPSRLRDKSLCRRFQWVTPAGLARAEKTEKTMGWDDKTLPVTLPPVHSNRQTAGLWYLNPSESYQKGQLDKATRRSLPLLYFHGGAYVTLEAGDVFVGLTLARMQARHAGLDVFSINYRLAPGSKYPSQLFEAYSAWVHLRRMGYKRILLGGDSAGANLALTLWRYLDKVAPSSETEAVAGLVLHSPWLDMDGHRRAGFQRNAGSCTIGKGYVEIGRKAMQTNNKPATNDPWFSPIKWHNNDFSRLPAVIVTNGGAETLLEEGQEFVRKARKAGVKVEHYVAVNHPHDFGAMFWFAGSIKEMHRAVSKWAKTLPQS